jgi:hypothetical protein
VRQVPHQLNETRAQVPTSGSGLNGWMQAIYNSLSDPFGCGVRTSPTAAATSASAARPQVGR